MLGFKVWVDADSCPKQVREHIIKSAVRYEFEVSFVANKEIISQEESAFCRMIVCGNGKDAADNLIFDGAGQNDIVITKDILFASRLVQKNICAMNDRGFVFTKHNIQDKLMERNFNMNLSEIGFGSKNKKTYYGEKEFGKFQRSFEREVESRSVLFPR
ncbi:MAG: DUF188 domain-containing protein [Treponema sp.]|nr:DUF188 domain-containing protein [Treponema sp.]